MMRALMLAAALLLPSYAFADPLVQESAPSQITVEKDGANFRVTTETRRYQTNQLPSVEAKNLLLYQLLEIDQRTVATEGPETEQSFSEANIKLTAYPLGDKGKGDAAFTIEVKADAVNAQNSFATFTHYGCCVEMPSYSVYSLETGKYLFSATGEGMSGQWATMGAQGGFKFERIFAYHAKFTALDGELYADQPNGAAIITYSGENAPLQRVMVIATAEEMEKDAPLEWVPKIDLVDAANVKGTDRIFVNKAGTAEDLFTGASVRLTLDDGHVIEIPVVADHLDLKAAKLPKGYSLIEMKL